MTRRIRTCGYLGICVAALCGLATAPPALATNFTITGQAKRPAWSGWWWPDSASKSYHLYDMGSTFAPLSKYGQWTGSTLALAWETANHQIENSAARNASWQGHCDGWAISSLLYPEPTRAVVAQGPAGQSGPVRFEPGDVKGLLAALWSGYDWRNSNSAGGTDLDAEWLHRFLLFFLAQNQAGVVFNVPDQPGAVWNFPCDGFKMTGTTDPSDPSRTNIAVELSMASDAVLDATDGSPSPNYLGRIPKLVAGTGKSYTYTYTVTGGDPRAWAGNDVQGMTAAWTGPSVTQHPTWVFCPFLGTNASGSPSPPSYVTSRHHPYAGPDFRMPTTDWTFRTLVEGLMKVSSGQLNAWRSGDYLVTPAGP
jgi:hypothetical protein